MFLAYANTRAKATEATSQYEKCRSDLVLAKRNVAERESKVEDLAGILRACGTIERATDTQDLFEIVAAEMPQLLHCSEATLFVLERGAEGSHLWTADGDEPIIALGVGALGRSAQDGEIRVVAATLSSEEAGGALSSTEAKVGKDGGVHAAATASADALLHAPLVVNAGEEPLGVLRLRCKRGQFVSKDKRMLVEDVAASLARVLLSCLVRQKAIRDLNEVAEMITTQSARLHGSGDDGYGSSGGGSGGGPSTVSEFSSLFLEVGSEMAKVLSCKMCTICLIDADQRPILSRAQTRAQGELVSHMAIAHVVEAREDLLVSDDAGMSAFDHGGHIRNMVCVPVFSSGPATKTDGNVSAVLQATNKIDGAFTESDLSMLKTVGEHLRCAVDATKRYTRSSLRAEQRERDLINLFDTFGGIHPAEGVARMELARALTDGASQALGAERVNLYLWDAESGKYRFFAAEDRDAGRGVRGGEEWFPTSKGIAGYVISRGQSLRLGSVRAHQSFDVSIDEPNGTRVNTAMYCPVLDGERAPLGAIQVANKLGVAKEESAGFSEEDERLLLIISRSVANHLVASESLTGAVLESERLESETEASAEEIKKLEEEKTFCAHRAAIAEGLVLTGFRDHATLETELFGTLCSTVDVVLGGAKCALYVANYESMSFELHLENYFNAKQVPMSDGLFQNLIKEREEIFFEDATAVLGAEFYAKDLILAPFVSSVAGDRLSQKEEGKLLGAIAFYNGRERALSKADVRSCSLVCARFSRLFTTVRGIGRLEEEFSEVDAKLEKSEASVHKLEGDLLFASRLLRIHGELDVLGQFSVSRVELSVGRESGTQYSRTQT